MHCPNFERQENGSGADFHTHTHSLRHIDERHSFRNQYAREHAEKLTTCFLSVLVPVGVCVCIFMLLIFFFSSFCIAFADMSEHKQRKKMCACLSAKCAHDHDFCILCTSKIFRTKKYTERPDVSMCVCGCVFVETRTKRIQQENKKRLIQLANTKGIENNIHTIKIQRYVHRVHRFKSLSLVKSSAHAGAQHSTSPKSILAHILLHVIWTFCFCFLVEYIYNNLYV